MLRMKNKLDKNGIEVFAIEDRQDCIDALNNLKEDTLKNKYMYDFLPHIESAIKAVKEESHDIALELKRKTNFKSLYRILYIYEKDYLYKVWENN